MIELVNPFRPPRKGGRLALNCLTHGIKLTDTKTVRLAIALLLTVIISPALSAQQYKRALVIDFKNRTNNPGLKYLEASITDEVRKKLKTEYSFQELGPKKWKPIAKKKYIY